MIILRYMKEQPYSLVNDGSSDSGVGKMNPVCALIFDVNKSKQVSFKFYDMCVTRGEHCSKAATLFDAIEEKLLKEGVSLENCISIGLDNTNSNVGEHNSVKSRVLENNPNCFIAGCSCHLAHLAAGKGVAAYASVSGFDIEDHQVDLYYYFKKSTHRKGILQEYLDFTDLQWENIVRYVQTRWLSLETCCDKELRKFPALQSMFNSRTKDSNKEDIGNDDEDVGDNGGTRFRRLKSAFQNPLTEVHVAFFILQLCLFLHITIYSCKGLTH